MSIDSAEKRKSISGVTIILIPGITPNSAKDAEWRAQSGWNYSGISFLAMGFANFDEYDDMVIMYRPIGEDIIFTDINEGVTFNG